MRLHRSPQGFLPSSALGVLTAALIAVSSLAHAADRSKEYRFEVVREPETNGVAERFIRTLKEQIVFGRIYQDIEEVRAAVRAYFKCYNQHWLLEKNGYRSPAEARRHWMASSITTHEAA